MKILQLIITLIIGVYLFAGCASGPYQPTQYDVEKDPERRFTAVVMDKALTRLISSKRVAILEQETQLTEDGRLRVFCEIRNMKKDVLRLQIQTVFKDENHLSIGQDTNWELVLIPGFGTYTYTTTALNDKAKKYTIRIQTAR